MRNQKNTSPKKQHTLLRLSTYLLRYKWLLLFAVILTLVSNTFALLGPMLSGYAIDAIQPGVGNVLFEKVFYYATYMLLFYVASSIFSYLLSILMIHIGRKIAYSMRQDVFEKLIKLPIGYFDTHQTGDILSRISYDIDTVNTSLSTDLVQISTSIITIIGAFSMMLYLSPKLVLVFVITVPLSILLTKYITGKTRPLFRTRSAKLGELNGFVEEMISGQKTLRAYHQEETTILKFSQKNKDAVNAYYDAEYYGSMIGPCVNVINNLSLSFISVFGALLYLAGSMSIGNISSFILYSRKFSGPINEAANILSDFQSALAAAERIFKLLDEGEESIDEPDAVTFTNVTSHDTIIVQGDVKASHVNFSYEPEKPILKDISFHAKPGNMIAVVGTTGSGKTTLINLLMRFYDVDSGNITVDEHTITHVTRSSLRKSYSMVLQDTWLFHGTIFENIAYGKESVTLEEVIEVAKAAKIHSFIMRLPNGYDTILSDDGTNISKGQKQLITIARAMLLDTNMLILDEATSNVDTRTVQQIQSAMRKIMKDKTCFVIAHRLSTIQNADCILVIHDGTIVESGTHDELLERHGVYEKMYMAQFEG
ncbi:ABC transporter ATP-binding protein [Anaerosporobacter sp.]|uniref:ABC transporter ATP-binding protein n=1 Tax=Anaerosporobacter sp. TaxID=1872529 RepID=UPI00286F7A90|nr:ABC transporter ATP-binding protein [Anaerosporobacter sp.]